MKIRKAHLRQCGFASLERRGENVTVVARPGVMPGARLVASDGSVTREIAVRTTLDRQIGLTRHPDGRWATVSTVDEVLVVAPSSEVPDSAEVLSYDPKVLIERFDAVVAARRKATPDLLKAPIFVALDEVTKGRFAGIASGLKRLAKWHTLVPLRSVALPRSMPPSISAFIEQTKREFAELTGLDVSQVVVDIRIRS